MFNKNVNMIGFILYLMKWRSNYIEKSEIYIDYITMTIKYFFKPKIDMKNYFDFENDLMDILKVVVDYPDVFYLSERYLRLHNPENLSKYLKEYKIPNKVKREFKNNIFRHVYCPFDFKSAELEHKRQVDKYIKTNVSYGNWLCELANSTDIVCEEKITFKDARDAVNVYLLSDFYEILSAYYKKNMICSVENEQNEKYLFLHKYEGKKMYIQMEKYKGDDGSFKYKFSKVEIPKTNKDIPYFPDIIFGVEEEVAQRKERVIGQIDDLFSQAKKLDINYETAVSKLQEVYKIDSNKK